MFKATDFRLIRRHCPDELNKLLQLLKIPAPNFDDGDEFEIYNKLDRAIDEKFCALLNCKSDLDGYAKLLDCGGIEFDSGETRNGMLKKILANREKILHGKSVTARSQTVKLTCRHAAKSFDFKTVAPRPIQNSVKTILENLTSVEQIVALEKTFSLRADAEQQIKNIVAAELGNVDEILLAVVPASAPPKKSDSPAQNVDEETFALLEQINKIFDKI